MKSEKRQKPILTKKKLKMRVMRHLFMLSVVIATISLTGCVTVRSEVSNNVTVKTVCPEMVNYDRATQERLAKEIAELPKGALLPELLIDYSKLRDICRAINR